MHPKYYFSSIQYSFLLKICNLKDLKYTNIQNTRMQIFIMFLSFTNMLKHLMLRYHTSFYSGRQLQLKVQFPSNQMKVLHNRYSNPVLDKNKKYGITLQILVFSFPRFKLVLYFNLILVFEVIWILFSFCCSDWVFFASLYSKLLI